ncbi:MAG: hypothetical protein M1839_008764 [Geoglossum umbratile]|nr:MAG: hypothetical protein M1839_008764 [Geoglossum umbratile]
MHLYSIFLAAAILPCASAFYPYPPPAASSTPHGRRSAFYTWLGAQADHGDSGGPPTLSIKRAAPKDDIHPHIRNVQEANHITRKYRSRGIPGPDVDGREALARAEQSIQQGTPVKRANAFPIVSAVQPTFTNSMAVNQDGTDFSYFSVVKFGSKGKPLYMLIDTGSASTWMMADTCTTTACQMHNTFGKSDSDTLDISTTPWSVKYGTGSVGGFIAKDKIAFAGFSIPLSFGLGSTVSDDFKSYPIDGILGLGRPQSSSLKTPTIMETLVSEKLIKANLFAVNLQRNSDGSNDGVVTFGDWDKSKFDGDLSWIDNVSKDGLWEIPVSDVAVGSNAGKFVGKTAIIDTGTSMILLPPNDAAKLHSLFPKMKQDGESFQIPCSSTQSILFTLGGVTYAVPPKDYLGRSIDDQYCASNIIGRQTFGTDQWLMGDTFLKNVYSVFDLDKGRIGFGRKAKAVDAPSASAVTSSQSPTSTSVGPTSTRVSGHAAPSMTTAVADKSSKSTTIVSGVPSPSSLPAASGANPPATARLKISFSLAICSMVIVSLCI